jgi:hypothetical protein
MSKTYEIDNIEFEINNIVDYLNNIKHVLIKMNIKLDSQEISKFLAETLNNELFDKNFKNETAYDVLTSKINDETKDENINLIEKQIREFNKSQYYKYYVNIEDVFYITFYKQIKYIKNIISQIDNYLKFNIKNVYIYTFLIQSLYDEPLVYKNYIYCLKKIKNDFINTFNIEHVEIILNHIFKYDNSFKDLMEKQIKERLEFIKKGIVITTLNYIKNYNCREDKDDDSKSETKSNLNAYADRDIENLEKKFYIEKCELLNKKREIIFDKNFDDIYNQLINNNINKDLWFGFILFLYKKFNLKKDVLDKIINNDYKPDVDFFDDLKFNKSIQIGGNIDYYHKYLKYKNKYILLKNKT